MHERDVELFDALATALTATDVERALEAALREIVRALDLAAGWIWLLDPETELFYLAAAHDLPPYLREPVQMTGDPCWCMESFVDGDFDSKNVDIIGCSRLRRGAREGGQALTLGLQSHASVVLRFGERRLGIMNVSPPVPRRLSERDLRLLAVTGAQIGLAVERGRLAEEEASAARSAERTRLAREIHDTLAQDLTAIALQLESAQRDVPDGSPAAARIATALDVARTSVAQARASVLSLRADPLAGRALPAALAALARRLTSETGMRVTLHEHGSTSLPYETEGELYRIASEALANARLHAKASRIEIELTGGDAAGRGRDPAGGRSDAESDGDTDGVERDHDRGAGVVTLRVRDDGLGFDPSSRDDERYGVRGMEERARLIGARFRVESGPGSGTLVEVLVPKAPQ